MKKINTKDWGKYTLGNLFDIVKGKRLTKACMIEGNINFVGSSAENNGITNKIGNDTNLHSGNLITVSYNGSVGEAFYQSEPFVASDDVNILIPKFKLSKDIAMFICPLIRNVGKNYAFVDKWSKDDMEKSEIYLPIDSAGNPDWQHVENCMKSIGTNVYKSISKFGKINGLEKTKVDIGEWSDFQIGDLFIVKRPDTRCKSNYENGAIPFVASGNFNNGVVGFMTPKENEELDKGNCITVSPLDGSSFYQKRDFLGRGGAGSAIIMLYNKKLNEFNGLFVASVIRRALVKYRYNDPLSSSVIVSEKIKLPVDSNGEPDWKYMENYMKTIEARVRDSLSRLEKVCN